MDLATRDDIIAPTPVGQSNYDFTLFETGGVSAVAVILALLTVGLVYLRYRSRRMTGIGIKSDDWTIFTAALFAVVLCALCIADTVIGSEAHDVDYIFNVVVPATSLGMACAITAVYASILALIKVSMLLLYKRIFTQKWMHIMANVLMVMTVFYWIFFVSAVSLFSVRLYQAYQGGRSRASWQTTQAVLILDVILDVIILVLPIPIVWRLKMTFGRKCQVLTLFMIGSLWMIASTVRLIYLSQSVYTSHYGDDSKFMNAVRVSVYFTIIATCVGIWHACLPTLNPLIDRFLTKHPRVHSLLKRLSPSRLTSRNRSSSHSRSGHLQPRPEYPTSYAVAIPGQTRRAEKIEGSEISLVHTAPSGSRSSRLPERSSTNSESAANSSIIELPIQGKD